MQRKSVIFVADSLDNAHKFQRVLSGLDVDVAAGSSLQFKKLLAQHPHYDLVIYEARGDALANVAQAEQMLVEDGSAAVVHGAGADECAARIRQLLWPGNEVSATDYLTVENMTINLATYQVKVGGEPLDFTYLEYALLAFLVTHPGRTYSRDALLRRVWGFDYYGGSRTVDVHVRRVRAKLGPDLAQHLETVRGVGYLWSA